MHVILALIMRMTKVLTGQSIVTPHATKDDECETLKRNSGGFQSLFSGHSN